MKTLAYALVGILAILVVPGMAAADCPLDTCPPSRDDLPPYCTVFMYTLNPPDYYLNPDCLLPPG